MNLVQKVKRLARNPAMQVAYLRWTLTRLALARPPLLKIDKNVRLGGWLSFTEYWVFHEFIPEPERVFMRQCMQLKQGRVVAFDVGANIGAFTCLLPSLGANEVHAFEPIPETFCRLKANVARNGLLSCCHLNCLAVGKASELVTFQVCGRSPDQNQLALSRDSAATESLQRVTTISLDAYCHSAKVQKIDFLKVDVEGMEPFVLRGARQLLAERKVGAILIEVCPRNLRSVGLTPETLFAEMTTMGYAPYELCADGSPGRRLDPKDIEAIVLGNVVLLPVESPA
jgi:FkbM family methyltransferase